MRTNRRRFLRAASGLFVPALLLPRRTLAQAWRWNDPAFMAAAKPRAAGPNTYYYTTEGDNDILSVPAGYTIWLPITFAQAGTLTKLGIKDFNSGATGVKIALYNGTTLVTSGTTTLPSITNTSTWVDITGLSAAVSAATYNIAFNLASAATIRIFGAASAAQYSALAYASFPPTPLPGSGTPWNYRLALRAFVA